MTADKLEPYKRYGEAVRKASAGQFVQIARAIGIEDRFLGRKNGPCPACEGTDRFRVDLVRECFFCSQGGNGLLGGDIFALAMHYLGCDFPTAQRRVGDVFGVRHPDDLKSAEAAARGSTKRSSKPLEISVRTPARRPVPREQVEVEIRPYGAFAMGLYEEAEVVTNACIGGLYLTARAAVIPPSDGDLRFHPALKHGPSGYVGPTLVGRITDIESGEPISLHRTWIRADGRKAEVDPPRMPLKGHRKKGGCVRLWPDDAVAGGLAIAEGIETALSLAHAFTPVWAVLDAWNLAAFPVLEGIESLTIAADHDPAGINAANECATRWTRAGKEVRIVMTRDALLNDLNDLAVAA